MCAKRFDKIMVIGFPKSGTSTIHRSLTETGFNPAHWQIKQGYVGKLMYKGLDDHSDPWFYLQEFDAITQADVCLPGRGINFWPNLDFSVIAAIERKYPSCLFVLNYRDPSKTVLSMKRWARMATRIKNADVPGLPAGV